MVCEELRNIVLLGVFRVSLTLAFFLGSSTVSNAQVEVTNRYGEFVDKARFVTQLSADDAFGDKVDLYTGSLSFLVNDLQIPVGDYMSINVARYFEAREVTSMHPTKQGVMGDWDLNIPRLSGEFAPDWHNERCSTATPPNINGGVGVAYVDHSDYWTGNTAHMPGGGKMLRLEAGMQRPSTGGPYVWVTKSLTFFSCLPSIKNGSGQGFLALDSNGTKYWFDSLARVPHSYFEKRDSLMDAWGGDTMRTAYVSVNRNYLYATRVEDRFGNWINYSYSNASAARSRLSSISASNGAVVNFTYDASGRVSEFTSASRTWSFSYDSSGSLSVVTLPDSSKWILNLSALTITTNPYPKGGGSDCFAPGWSNGPGAVVGTITSPSGAVATYVLDSISRGRSNVPAMCNNMAVPRTEYTQQFESAVIPSKWFSYALKSRQVSGPGVPAAQWGYSYSSDSSVVYKGGGTPALPICTGGGCLEPSCTSPSCAGRNVVTIANPDGTSSVFTFGNSYKYDEGLLLSQEKKDSSGILLESITKYYNYDLVGQPYVARIGNASHWRTDSFVDEFRRPLLRMVVVRDGRSFEWKVDSGCAGASVPCFDEYVRPVRTIIGSY